PPTTGGNPPEPVTFCRSPIITKPVSGVIEKGSSPLNEVTVPAAGTLRGGRASTAAGSAPTWSAGGPPGAARAGTGSSVAPQQPPRTFARPLSANSRRYFEVVSGRSS